MVDVLSQPEFAEAWAGGAGVFRALIDNLGHCVYLLDGAGRCLALNRAFGQWLGRPEAEVLGGTLFDLWPRPLADKEVLEHQQILRQGERIEAEEDRPRGRQSVRVRIVKVPVRDDHGEVQGVLCLFHEAPPSPYPLPPGGERRTQEHSLSTWEEREKQEPLLSPEGERGIQEHPLLPGGERATFGSPLSPSGEEGRVRGSESDETAERQTSKMELLGRLASGIVHDFNNLLSVQLNNLALVQAGLPPGTALEDSLHALRKAINQGAALTDRLLMLVRKDSRGLQAVDLNKVCTEATELLKNSIAPRIVLEAHLRPGLPAVHGDPGQLMQVLMNLCFNACDAMPRGGRLLIETESVPLPASRLSPAAAGSKRRLPESGMFVCLHVSDTGEGIPPEVRPRIFEPFFTTKPAGQGTGLGLAIVAEIVQRAEGWIDCSTNVGRGTRFTVWLPAVPPTLPSPSLGGEERISPPSPPRGGEGRAGGNTYAGADVTPRPLRSLAQKTILLADNEPSIVLLAQTILQRHGYRVLPTADGRQALEMYRQKHTVVDLIILDQDMPGLSGLETMNELLKINSQARVLIVTGGPPPEPSWGTGTSGWGFLSKPFTAEQLVQAVRDVLSAPIVDRGS